MSNQHTRRRFLQLSALGLAATTRTGWARSMSEPEGQISVHVTGGSQRYASGPPLAWRTGAARAENAIRIDPGKKYQELLGFGAAFTDAACYMFSQLSPAARESVFHELFHPSEMNLNVCRTCMGSSDYSTEMFSYDEGEPDPEMQRFSIAHDKAYVLPMLREARRVNPDLFLFSSPWSPPGWMKAGGAMLGGSMRQHFLAPYAQYFLRFVEAYSAEGVTVDAVTVQNEVDTDQDGRMPACSWPQEYEIAFVRDHLGPLFQKHSISTKIWILDHNYNLWGRAVAELDDRGLRKYSDSIAFHGYVGQPEMMSKAHEAHPEAQIYWTEGGPDYTAPDYATDWVNWAQTFTAILRNWAQSITGWNLTLDEKGRPNIGPFSCGGLVTINSQSKEITRSGQYWAFAHLSRSIRRGARRVDSSSTVSGIDHVAFENRDGKKALVVTNSGDSRTLWLEQGNRTAELTLPAKSVSTFEWTS